MEQPRRAPRFDPLLTDSLIAVGLTLLAVAQLNMMRLMLVFGLHAPRRFPEGFGFGYRFMAPGPATWLLVALIFLPLALRRRFPLAVLGVVTVAEAVFEFMPHPPSFSIFGPLLALYTVGTLYQRRTVVIAAAAASVALLAASLPPIADRMWLPEFARILAMVAFAAALGNGVRTQRAYLSEAERRAEEAEGRAEEEAARRVDEERLRIARELHDVTAHSLSVVAVQSGAAAHVLETDPQAARKALEDIRVTSRDALNELRSVVGSLRGAGEPAAPLAPTPGLARVADLVRPVEDAGMRVTIETSGDLDDIPQLVDASAYRIVQEALTNVIRHAGPAASASVRVARAGEALTIEVTDTGTQQAAGGEGHGIAGMRERAVALGGSFEAGPRPEGGWRVHAELPLRKETP
jgi:signal transduction histidine kinase